MVKQGVAFILPLIALALYASGADAARTELISRAPTGEVGNGESKDPSISADGRYVVYESRAENLVDDKTTSNRDIFLYDRLTRTTTRVSAPGGVEGNSSSYDAEISANGNVIVFASGASNLVSGDSQGNTDIFWYDRNTDTLERVSVSSNGTAANDDSGKPDVSADGRYIVFESDATNLAPGDSNNQKDIFRHDRQTGATIRINFDFLGNEVEGYDSEEPVISDNGRYVAFQTRADLGPCDDNHSTDIYVRDVVTGDTMQGSVTDYGCCPNGGSVHPSISGDGRFISFSSSASDLVYAEEDTNSRHDVYIHDQQLQTTERISIATDGTEGAERSVGYGGNISSDGRYVVFSSEAENLVKEDGNGGYDVFARDRQTKITTREGVGHYWESGTGSSTANVAVISSGGKYIVFDSGSPGIVPDDNNSTWDIFIREYLWEGPIITSIFPQSGDFKGGTLVTVMGDNFAQGAAITIGGKQGLNVSVNAQGTMITFITPPNELGKVELTVTNPNGGRWTYPIGRGAFDGYLYRSPAMPNIYLLLLE